MGKPDKAIVVRRNCIATIMEMLQNCSEQEKVFNMEKVKTELNFGVECTDNEVLSKLKILLDDLNCHIRSTEEEKGFTTLFSAELVNIFVFCHCGEVVWLFSH